MPTPEQELGLVNTALELQRMMGRVGAQLDAAARTSSVTLSDRATALVRLSLGVFRDLISTREGKALAKLSAMRRLGYTTLHLIQREWFQTGMQDRLAEFNSEEARLVDIAFRTLNDRIGVVQDAITRWQVEVPEIIIDRAISTFYSVLSEQVDELAALLAALLKLMGELAKGDNILLYGALAGGTAVGIWLLFR